MKFWDASALVPLMIEEPNSARLRDLVKNDSTIIAWWGAPVECMSAFSRKKREGAFNDIEWDKLKNRLNALLGETDMIEPSIILRDKSLRLLTLHPLRAGDALQLAAALRWCQDQTREVGFVSLDERLRAAAAAEGFSIFP